MLIRSPLLELPAPVRAKDLDDGSLYPNIIVCAHDLQAMPVLNALRKWAESARPVPDGFFWSASARVTPHIVLICGAIGEDRVKLLRNVERWQRQGVLVIWIVPFSGETRSGHGICKMAKLDRDVLAAVSATVVVHSFDAGLGLQTDENLSIVRAAKGLLHPIRFLSLVCVDLSDVRASLTNSGEKILFHFDVSQGFDACMEASPLARQVIANSKSGLVSTTFPFPDERNILRECLTFVESAEPHFSEGAEFLLTLNLKQAGTPFEADLYAACAF